MTTRERNLRRVMPELTDEEVSRVLKRFEEQRDLDEFQTAVEADLAALTVEWSIR